VVQRGLRGPGFKRGHSAKKKRQFALKTLGAGQKRENFKNQKGRKKTEEKNRGKISESVPGKFGPRRIEENSPIIKKRGARGGERLGGGHKSLLGNFLEE